MALASDIQALRDRSLADLNAAHDYYTDTKGAWDIVRRFIAAGNTLSIHNHMTGTTTTHVDLVGKLRGYVAEQLAEATFQQFITIFENFLFELLRLWLVAHPKSLGAKTVEFRRILDAPDIAAITLQVVNHELNEVFYERPAEWFKYLESKVKLGCPTADEIARIAEAKASRDVLVHNRGVANTVYESKASHLARYKNGERIDIPENYHRQTWELLGKVVSDTASAALGKA
jgi:hypothetical protein